MKIYHSNRVKAGQRYTQFDVADYTSGRRKFISFADEGEARRKALGNDQFHLHRLETAT